MKRLLVIIFLAISFLFVSHSKSYGQIAYLVLIFGDKLANENFYFTAVGGFSVNFPGDYMNSSPGVGVNFGFIANIRINQKLFFAPEFVPFSLYRINHVERINTGNPDIDPLFKSATSIKRAYQFELPVTLRYQMTDHFAVSGGPYIGFWTSVKNKYTDKIDDDKIEYTQDVGDNFETLDFGFVADVSFSLTKKVWKGPFLRLRYKQGLRDMYKPSGEIYSSTLTLQLALPFVETAKCP
ncbi:hypothetical protein FUAX_38780 (plasmid) [Fulvitalea axinellae]|uniref:Outer membrane protein beta-barrel domain-containing protein n=1 Tax=Fulvitalea axinellae TaxID=1182444 RepID=A0AAU9CQJ8_9BACT|nr:hypothetical protein FUAX_38780 [Fulvitalea axinellae]